MIKEKWTLVCEGMRQGWRSGCVGRAEQRGPNQRRKFNQLIWKQFSEKAGSYQLGSVTEKGNGFNSFQLCASSNVGTHPLLELTTEKSVLRFSFKCYYKFSSFQRKYLRIDRCNIHVVAKSENKCFGEIILLFYLFLTVKLKWFLPLFQLINLLEGPNHVWLHELLPHYSRLIALIWNICLNPIFLGETSLRNEVFSNPLNDIRNSTSDITE